MKIRLPSRRTGCLLASMLVLLGFVVLYLSATVFPSVGAQGAEVLRHVIGDEATAQLEMFVFQAQDIFHQVKFGLGIEKAEAPWQVAKIATATASMEPATTTPSLTPVLTSTPTATLAYTSTPLPPTATPTPTPWSPPLANSLGKLEGEGIWTPYIFDIENSVVAYRTFILPDPKRPYTQVGVVAFNLNKTRLRFVPGTEEPVAPKAPARSGSIPLVDLKPGVVLATFNGGFKATHGNYGAYVNGVTLIPPREKAATVAIYDNGEVKIGEWGKDITSSEHILAWRQNCHLIIQDGEINPLVKVDTAEYWGANLNGATVTWRSGLGISPDGKTLYYFAGSSMMASILAETMMAMGVQNGMQLDINNYWVHFASVRSVNNKNLAEPLFPEDMKISVDRYLVPHARDFFYVAVR